MPLVAGWREEGEQEKERKRGHVVGSATFEIGN